MGMSMAGKKPKADDAHDRYDKKRRASSERERKQSARGREIGPLPKVANPKRRSAATKSFRKFCETYFRSRFNKPWGPHHLEVMADFERIIRGVGIVALAMPRGSGKTALCEVAVLWAILCHGHRFVMLIAASKAKAIDLMTAVRTGLEFNDVLAEDFPEVCLPIQSLEGANQRKPMFNGERIIVRASKTEIVMPPLSGTSFRGGVIRCGGLLGSEIRGTSFVVPGGDRLRPTLFIADDPQTDRSAASDKQNNQREGLLAGAVLGMAGPGAPLSGIVPCTVICPNDMADRILSRDLHPEYGGRRYKMLSWMADEKDLTPWRQYGEERREGLRNDDQGAAGNNYWKKHRKLLESLAKATWPEHYDPGEMSAVQHAVNLWLRDRQAFYAEAQNDPLAGMVCDIKKLDVKQLLTRRSGRARGIVPQTVQFLSAGLDCHDDLLYWAVAGLEDVPTGYVIDYATWPRQTSRYFLKRDASPTIESFLHKRDKIERDEKARLYAALDAAVTELVELKYQREESNEIVRIGKIVIDAGYLPDVVFRYCRESKYSAMLFPTQGATAAKMPNPARKTTGGARWSKGEDYYVPPPGRRPVRYAVVNGPAWVAKVHNGFMTPRGAAGAWMVFEAPTAEHRCFFDHLVAEDPIDELKADGSRVRRYILKPGADNHWLDSTKLAWIGGEELGCQVSYAGMGQPSIKGKRAPKVSYH
jgi:hypothetical protein